MALVTVGPSGRDYTSLFAAEAGEQQDLTALAETMAFEMDAMADPADGAKFDGWTVSTTYYVILRGASGVQADLPYGDSGYRLTGSATCLNLIGLQFTRVQDLCLITSDSGGARKALLGGGGEIFDRCVFVASHTSYSGNLVEPQNHASQDTVFRNCVSVIVGTSGQGFVHQGGSGTARFYNCTAIGGANGFDRDFGAAQIINCLADGQSGTGFTSTWETGSGFNASWDATAPGDDSRQSQTFTFVDGSGGDYRLASGDAGARTFGSDLSGISVGPFSDDFDAIARGATWDIGADQFVAAGGASPLLAVLQAHGAFIGSAH